MFQKGLQPYLEILGTETETICMQSRCTTAGLWPFSIESNLFPNIVAVESPRRCFLEKKQGAWVKIQLVLDAHLSLFQGLKEWTSLIWVDQGHPSRWALDLASPEPKWLTVIPGEGNLQQGNKQLSAQSLHAYYGLDWLLLHDWNGSQLHPIGLPVPPALHPITAGFGAKLFSTHLSLWFAASFS